ncbi:MAG TPA: ABC transporter substrate-binding protein [Burkholderiales bacterium]|nr:ABC transporter substrate-binding protein [Burkholderiales bacterium]
MKTVLVALLFASFAAHAQTPGRTYRIGFAQIVDHPALNATRQGFIDGLKASGFEVGRNLVFDYQNAQGDPGTARNIIEKFMADKADLIAPCTTPVVQAAIRLTKGSRTPVAFGCVTNPVQTGVLQTVEKPTGTNVTGFYTVPPVKRNFDLFLAIKPGMKTVGTIWNSAETNSEAMNKLARAEAESRGIRWLPVTVTSSAEIRNAAESLVGKVDALVTPQDNTVASAYEALIKTFRDARVPWFSLDVLAVERGAIAAVAQHQYQNGVDWARKVAVPVLQGKDPGTLLAVEAEVFEVHVNVAAARAAGLQVPDSVLKQATKVFGQ